jgi:DNA primase
MKKDRSILPDLYQKKFKSLEDNAWAKEMMFNERGFQKKTIQEFAVGFAPDEKAALFLPINQ